MKTFKSTALVFITMAACLILLLAPDLHQDTAVSDLTQSAETNPVTFGNNPSTAITQHAQIKFEQDQPGAIAEIAATAQRNDWRLDLYPQLARITQLDNQPPDIALGELLPMLSDTDPVIRLAALQSVANMNQEARLPIFMAALDDPNHQIRVAALEALATTDHASVAASIEPYVYDRELEVRIAAIDALGEMESKIAADTLGGLLSDGNTLVRHHAVNALGEIGGEYAITYLLQARYDADETIRTNANAILEE